MPTNLAETKAQLRAEFPGWSIIQSRPSGRWWATRGPGPGEQVNHGPSAVEADTPEELRDALRQALSLPECPRPRGLA